MLPLVWGAGRNWQESRKTHNPQSNTYRYPLHPCLHQHSINPYLPVSIAYALSHCNPYLEVSNFTPHSTIPTGIFGIHTLRYPLHPLNSEIHCNPYLQVSIAYPLSHCNPYLQVSIDMLACRNTRDWNALQNRICS